MLFCVLAIGVVGIGVVGIGVVGIGGDWTGRAELGIALILGLISCVSINFADQPSCAFLLRKITRQIFKTHLQSVLSVLLTSRIFILSFRARISLAMATFEGPYTYLWIIQRTRK